MEIQMTYIQQLADAARPINEADYGSDRQVRAENDFYDALAQYTASLPIEAQQAFDAFCLKATVDERITEGLRLVKLAQEL
jgi:hypothetical protein